MSLRETTEAIRAFENAQKLLGDEFRNHMDLGMLYMADGRFSKAAVSLDKVPSQHPGYAVALFKRAQASVLLNEIDRENRVRQAWVHANQTTRPLILADPLFEGIDYR